MSDQPNMESPESRLEAMLGDIKEEPQEVEIVEDTVDESEDGEEIVEDTFDDEEPEMEDDVEEDSEEQPIQSVKLKVNGEEIEKPLDEIVALAQQGLDYTQKTQQVAEQRKQLENLQEQIRVQEIQIQQQAQLANYLQEDVAKITALDQQLNQYQDVDWQKLSDSDFVQAQKLFFDYNKLQQERSKLVSQFDAKQQYAMQEYQSMQANKIAKGREELAKKIPNWSPETIQSLVSIGREYGFSEGELSSVYDPRHVEVLHDAMQWRLLKSKNSVTKKKIASAKPVVKPGSKDPKKAVSSNTKKMREQLRRTGSSELASKLIENMI